MATVSSGELLFVSSSCWPRWAMMTNFKDGHMKLKGTCSCVFSFKEVPSSRMAASNGPRRLRITVQRTFRGRVLPCTPQWPHSLQRSQQSQSWRCSQGYCLHVFTFIFNHNFIIVFVREHAICFLSSPWY